MSLLAEIQQECVRRDADVSRLLRLCLQLAARLKHEPLKAWVLHELNGYQDRADLPDYRVYATRSRGFFADRYVGQFTLDIPMGVVDEPARSRFSEARLDQPIRQYEELLAGGSTDNFHLPWPQELALHYGPKVSQIQCMRIWQELPRAALAGLIDTVKTRVLSMVLEIEAEYPSAGEIEGATPISEGKVSQIFNTNIYGGQVGNLAAGSPGAVQSVRDQVVQGDLESLKNYLGSIGVERTDVAELVDALDADRASGQSGMGSGVAGWLGKLGQKAKKAGSDASVQIATGLATQAILTFLGIGG